MINGKPRENIDVAPDISEEDAKAAALASDAAKRFMDGKDAKRVIFIPGGGNREPKINIVV
jgi:leucyl-tRNA synthetase